MADQCLLDVPLIDKKGMYLHQWKKALDLAVQRKQIQNRVRAQDEMDDHLCQLRKMQGCRQETRVRQRSIIKFCKLTRSAASTGRPLKQHKIHPSQLIYLGFDRLRVPAQRELPGILENDPDNNGKWSYRCTIPHLVWTAFPTVSPQGLIDRWSVLCPRECLLSLGCLNNKIM